MSLLRMRSKIIEVDAASLFDGDSVFSPNPMWLTCRVHRLELAIAAGQRSNQNL
jgi:hypothetical protein